MKMLALHDRDGNLAALVAGPPDVPPAMLAAEPGLIVTEVEVPWDAEALSRLQSEDQSRAMLRGLRVEHGDVARLVKEGDGGERAE